MPVMPAGWRPRGIGPPVRYSMHSVAPLVALDVLGLDQWDLVPRAGWLDRLTAQDVTARTHSGISATPQTGRWRPGCTFCRRSVGREECFRPLPPRIRDSRRVGISAEAGAASIALLMHTIRNLISCPFPRPGATGGPGYPTCYSPGPGQSSLSCRNANVPTPWMACGPLKYSISVLSPRPSAS